jgi:GT2 family glycosyltransferase
VGIKSTASDILAFTDDDIVADRDWIAKLLHSYEQMNPLAIGGRLLPIWLSGEPTHLPEELYWLIGVTHESFLSDKVKEIRNTFGPNMSFKRVVFEEVGYFNENLSFADRGTSYIQGEEPEFGLRMLHKFNRGIVYNPQAIIYHKVPYSKLKTRVLLKRSYYQGYSKAIIQKSSYFTSSLKPEKSYLKNVLLIYLPLRIRNIFTSNSPMSEIKKLLLLIACVTLVGIGFIYGHIKFLGSKP